MAGDIITLNSGRSYFSGSNVLVHLGSKGEFWLRNGKVLLGSKHEFSWISDMVFLSMRAVILDWDKGVSVLVEWGGEMFSGGA